MNVEKENHSHHSLKRTFRNIALFALFEISTATVLFYLVENSLIDINQFSTGIIVVQGCVLAFIIASISGSVFKKRLGSKKSAH